MIFSKDSQSPSQCLLPLKNAINYECSLAG